MCESGLRTISMKIKSPEGGFFFALNPATPVQNQLHYDLWIASPT